MGLALSHPLEDSKQLLAVESVPEGHFNRKMKFKVFRPGFVKVDFVAVAKIRDQVGLPCQRYCISFIWPTVTLRKTISSL